MPRPSDRGQKNTPARRLRWPGLYVQCTLDRGRGGDGIGRTGEDGEAAIALAARSHDLPAVLGDDLLDESIMPR